MHKRFEGLLNNSYCCKLKSVAVIATHGNVMLFPNKKVGTFPINGVFASVTLVGTLSVTA